MRTARQIHDPFPLTPALSLWERENRPPSHSYTCDWIRVANIRKKWSPQSLFPLPEGEGQGEGKASQFQELGAQLV